MAGGQPIGRNDAHVAVREIRPIRPISGVLISRSVRANRRLTYEDRSIAIARFDLVSPCRKRSCAFDEL
jgi:hypothetical protein